MKMSAHLPASDLLPMELPSMSLPEGSRAKTFLSPEKKPELVKGHAAGFGPRLCDLLATFSPDTSSWRTSQTCFLALAKNEADGLAEYSETWPSAGIMRNGKTYRRQLWALPIVANVSGLWPTPIKNSSPGSAAFKLPDAVAATLGLPMKPYQKNVATFEKWRQLWPAPTARDHKGGRKPETLAASGRGASNSLNDALTCQGEYGALNPVWVEWLMGFPIGHTDLKD